MSRPRWWPQTLPLQLSQRDARRLAERAGANEISAERYAIRALRYLLWFADPRWETISEAAIASRAGQSHAIASGPHSLLLRPSVEGTWYPVVDDVTYRDRGSKSYEKAWGAALAIALHLQQTGARGGPRDDHD